LAPTWPRFIGVENLNVAARVEAEAVGQAGDDGFDTRRLTIPAESSDSMK
jgi:hypothetical protein